MKKRILSLCLLVVGLLLLAVPVYRGTQSEGWVTNFEDNGKGLLYSQGEALEEKALFTAYVDDFREATADWAIAGVSMPVTLRLEQPISYYRSPGDAEPAFTLEAGKEYLILADGLETCEGLAVTGANASQYGLFSWPTYERGWRYAVPFAPAEALEQIENGTYPSRGMYYVRLSDLQAVRSQAEAYLKEQYAAMDRPYDDQITAKMFSLDYLLYLTGNYESPDFIEETGDQFASVQATRLRHTFDVWDGLCAALGAVALGAAIFFFLKGKGLRAKPKVSAKPAKKQKKGFAL